MTTPRPMNALRRFLAQPIARTGFMIGAVVAAALGPGSTGPIHAGELEVRYERVAGTGDPIPGAPAGTVFAFATGAQPAGANVIFYGQNATGSIRGYYIHDGQQVRRVLDTTMIPHLPEVPQEPDLQIYFGSLYMPIHVGQEGLTAVVIETDHPGHVNAFWAIYAWRSGAVSLIAAKGQQPPGGPPGSRFMAFGVPRVRGDVVYFAGTREGMSTDKGYYSWHDGALEEITFDDLYFTSPIPAPTGVCAVAVDPDPVGHPAGIWCREDGATEHELVFDLGQPFPGGTGHWGGVPNSRLHRLDDGLLMAGRSSTNDASGLYRMWHEWVEPVLTNTDLDPITGDPFTLWWMYSGAGQRVAFTGYDPADFRLRLRLQDEDRSFHKLVDEGDMFEGQMVGWVNLHFGAFSGDRLAFSLARSNDSAVWVADFGPDPGPGPGDGPSVLEIPTLGSAARAVLVLLLVLSGGWVLRRPRRG